MPRKKTVTKLPDESVEDYHKRAFPDGTKQCTKCKDIKPLSDFGLRKGVDVRSDCKKCVAKNTKKYRDENPLKVYLCNLMYLSEHKEEAKQWNKAYYEKHRIRLRVITNANRKKRFENNIQAKIIANCRTRVCGFMKYKKAEKFAHTIDLLGCSVEFFVNWLEWQFDENMSWDNYGTYWEIDHVMPCNAFDMTIEEEQFECFNWRNCRPCEVSENRSKNDSILLKEIDAQEEKVYCYLNKVVDTIE
jgi:hypothetical protein